MFGTRIKRAATSIAIAYVVWLLFAPATATATERPESEAPSGAPVGVVFGEQYDPDLGLYYLRARFYNPQTGRFWNMDSWEGQHGNPITLNKYLYGNANPILYVDPTGHFGSTASFSMSSAVAGGLMGASIGGYRAARTGNSVIQGVGVGFAAGFLGGGMAGAVSAATWTTWRGVTVLSMMSGMALNMALNDFQAGYPDLALMEAAFAFAPLVIAPRPAVGVRIPTPRMSPSERLVIFFTRLKEAPPVDTPSRALAQIQRILNAVEDQHSGVQYQSNAPLEWTGRMYPPRSDNIFPAQGGGLVARTKGHNIELKPNGSIKITERGSDKVVFEKKGNGS